MGIRGDLQLYQRAMRYPGLDADAKRRVIERVMELIDDPDTKPRVVIGASKVILAAESQVQKDEQDKTQQDINKFASMLEHIRANGSLIGFTDERAD